MSPADANKLQELGSPYAEAHQRYLGVRHGSYFVEFLLGNLNLSKDRLNPSFDRCSPTSGRAHRRTDT